MDRHSCLKVWNIIKHGEIHKIKDHFCTLNGHQPLLYGDKYITYGG